MNKQGGIMNTELIKALRCKECFDLCNVESCRYHLTNTKSGCKCAIKLMATDAADALEAADKRVKELEEAQRWIPCAERLPKKEQENQQRGFYLVALENGVVKELAFEFGHYENMLFDPGWHDTAYPVTHWQALPQPPQKG